MNEIIAALLEPQVLVAFFTFVVGPIVGVLIAASREAKDPVTPPDPKPVTGERRVRRDDVVVIEAFAQWADRQQQEIKRLKADLRDLRSQVNELRRVNLALRQHNEVLIQQLRRLGETPFPPARWDERN